MTRIILLLAVILGLAAGAGAATNFNLPGPAAQCTVAVRHNYIHKDATLPVYFNLDSAASGLWTKGKNKTSFVMFSLSDSTEYPVVCDSANVSTKASGALWASVSVDSVNDKSYFLCVDTAFNHANSTTCFTNSSYTESFPMNEASGSLRGRCGLSSLTPTGSPTYHDAGPISGLMSIGVTTGQGFSNNIPALKYEYSDQFTVAFWVKTTLNEVGGDLICNATNDGTYRGWFINWGAVGKVMIGLSHDWSGAFVGARIHMTNALIADANWHYVVCVNQGTGTAAGLHIYVDGLSQDVGADNDNLASQTIVSTGENFYINGGIISARGTENLSDVSLVKAYWDTARVATEYNKYIHCPRIGSTLMPIKRYLSATDTIMAYVKATDTVGKATSHIFINKDKEAIDSAIAVSLPTGYSVTKASGAITGTPTRDSVGVGSYSIIAYSPSWVTTVPATYNIHSQNYKQWDVETIAAYYADWPGTFTQANGQRWVYYNCAVNGIDAFGHPIAGGVSIHNGDQYSSAVARKINGNWTTSVTFDSLKNVFLGSYPTDSTTTYAGRANVVLPIIKGDGTERILVFGWKANTTTYNVVGSKVKASDNGLNSYIWIKPFCGDTSIAAVKQGCQGHINCARVFVCAQDYSVYPCRFGVAISSDTGSTWTFHTILSSAANTSDCNEAAICEVKSGGNYGASGSEVLKVICRTEVAPYYQDTCTSIDGGTTWTPPGPVIGSSSTLGAAPGEIVKSVDTLYYFYGYGMLRGLKSIDQGATWVVFSDDIFTPASAFGLYASCGFDPNGKLYALWAVNNISYSSVYLQANLSVTTPAPTGGNFATIILVGSLSILGVSALGLGMKYRRRTM
jgi:hypothetical protein